MNLKERVIDLTTKQYCHHLIGELIPIGADQEKADGRKEYEQSYFHLEGEVGSAKSIRIIVLNEGKVDEVAYWKEGAAPKVTVKEEVT